MEIIDDLESEPRGPYGGGVGYVSWDGDADTAIVIRTATVEHDLDEVPEDARSDDSRITVRAGAGIVADSDSESEYEETESKMGGVLDAVDAIRGDVETGRDGGSHREGEPDADDRTAEPEVSR